MMSLKVPTEKYEELSCLIDMGFSASQVTEAMNKNNTTEMENLIDVLRIETQGKKIRTTETRR